jgi:hypothetical protein
MLGEVLGRRRGVSSALGLLVALTLVVGLMAVPSAGAGGGTASIAKKKCKKKGKKASSAKKKKCKKKKKVVLLPAPLVRGTITWNESTEVDLHAYDAIGNHAGYVSPAVVQGIPNATHSGDVNGVNGKSESFTDNIYLKGGVANREFSFIGCFYGPATTGTFTGVTAAGVVTTLPINQAQNTEVFYQVPGGPPAPVTDPC